MAHASLGRAMVILFAAAWLVGASAAGSAKTDKLKLKPGAKGKICLDCHAGFEDVARKPFVHTPVKKGECTGCHNPHASEHAKLLAGDVKEICPKCHQVVPKDAKSSHQPATQADCTSCHDVHASNNRFVLNKPEKDLCASCHAALVDAAGKAKHKHRPLEQEGCTSCHDPHGSAKADHLLKRDAQSLCVSCHQVDKPVFIKQHMSYPVARADCTSCHGPHGSNQIGMLHNDVHAPVAQRMCAQCHDAPSARKPFATKRLGIELCRGCHARKLTPMLEKKRVHPPLTDETACLNCHTPHASAQKGLIKAGLTTVCGACHADTFKRLELSPTKHQPVSAGQCPRCHDPHSSGNPLMLVRPNTIELCGTCHDWQKHSTHPIGPEHKDPRNPNLTIDCLSCHQAHGTEYKSLVPFPTTSALCTQCHVQFKR